MTVGERLREIRGFRSLEEFSKLLSVKVLNISSIENGRSKMSIDLAVEISNVYNVSLDWLLKGVGTKDGKPEEEPKSEKPSIDVVTIPKDELLDLYRRLDKKNTEEIQKKEAKIEELEQNLEKAKNV